MLSIDDDESKPRLIPVATGPTTASYLRSEAGLQVDIVCKKPEAGALVAAIERLRPEK
jgi:uroporphyrinogen-III synthase